MARPGTGKAWNDQGLERSRLGTIKVERARLAKKPADLMLPALIPGVGRQGSSDGE
jgi:hypothetical protein